MDIRTKIFSLLALSLAVLIAPATAWACGGFFCNQQTQVPIFQAGERVVFAQDDNGVEMHIEIAYEGEPTSFGWIMPILEAPTDENGEIAPLEDFLRVSHPRLFNQVMMRTNPSFNVNNTFEEDTCWEEEDDWNAVGGFSDAAAGSGGEGGADAPPPPVVVLQEAEIGPYNSQLIKATDGDALFAWLNENGYIQDEKARPIIDHYVAGDYVFLGLRLQNGKSAGAIKPVSLKLGELAPCVPLKLTAIAAMPDMPIRIWVLGDSRAIPKNFIHGVINPAALIFGQGNNYVEVVNEAVNTLNGHAWLTEFAGSTEPFEMLFSNSAQEDTSDLESAKDLGDIFEAMQTRGLSQDPDFIQILRDAVPMPAGLTGYPFGDCYLGDAPPEPEWDEEWWWDAGSSWAECPSNEDHITTDAEFYAYIGWWQEELASTEQALDADLDAISTRIIDELINVLAGIQDMFDNAATLTRFFTTQSAEEMTKDPIFAFNPDLPDVDGAYEVDTIVSNPTCEGEIVTATYSTGQKYIFDCDGSCWGTPTVGPVPGAPALLDAQVIDESGEPRSFDPAYAQIVDAKLTFAEVGKPSLPEGFELPPPSAFTYPAPKMPEGMEAGNGEKGSSRSGGCQLHDGASFPLWLFGLLALAVLPLVRRRRENA